MHSPGQTGENHKISQSVSQDEIKTNFLGLMELKIHHYFLHSNADREI
jgi:hypothetical protein